LHFVVVVGSPFSTFEPQPSSPRLAQVAR
jgi:hypothetical protein